MSPLPAPSSTPTAESSSLLSAVQVLRSGPAMAGMGLTTRVGGTDGSHMGPATAEALSRFFADQQASQVPRASAPAAIAPLPATMAPNVRVNTPAWYEQVDRQYATYCRVNPGTAVTLQAFRRASERAGVASASEAFRVENLMNLPEEPESDEEEGREVPVLGRRRAFSTVLTAQRRPSDDPASVNRLYQLLRIVDGDSPLQLVDGGAPAVQTNQTVHGMTARNLRPTPANGPTRAAPAQAYGPPGYYNGLPRAPAYGPPGQYHGPPRAPAYGATAQYYGGPIPTYGMAGQIPRTASNFSMSSQFSRSTQTNGKRFRRVEAMQMSLHRQGITVPNPSSKLRRTLRREAIFGKPDRRYDGKPLPKGDELKKDEAEGSDTDGGEPKGGAE